jgi:hypothetical protein
VIAFACFMMFWFHLWAIIRKGGLGLPSFCSPHIHYVSLHKHFWKKIAQENGMSPLWVLGCLLLFWLHWPFVDLQATNDIGLINMDVILTQSKNYKKLFPQNKYLPWLQINTTNTIEEAIEDIRQGRSSSLSMMKIVKRRRFLGGSRK